MSFFIETCMSYIYIFHICNGFFLLLLLQIGYFKSLRLLKCVKKQSWKCNLSVILFY